MRAQQRSPTSPYTGTAATPTTSHQLQQLRYQQQQQQQQQQQSQQSQHSPHSHYYANINQHTPYNAQPQPQQQQHNNNHQPITTQHHHLSLAAIDSLDSLDMPYDTNTRSPYDNYPPTQPQTHQRSPNTNNTHTTMNSFELPKVQPIIPTPPQQTQPQTQTDTHTHTQPPAYSGSNESDHNSPQSIDAFPDTLPVLDEQNNHSYDGGNKDTISDDDHEETPIPSDEQKLSSSPNSNSLQRLIQQEQDAETASERAFLRELSQIALDETNQTNDKIVSDLTEIDEQMQLESTTDISTTKTPSPTSITAPSIGRSISHLLGINNMRINMKAPLIRTLERRYKQGGAATVGASPITSPIIPNINVNTHNSHSIHSPPRIKMPNANNMISYSSTTTTPTSTGADVVPSSPVTPNRRNYYYQHHHHRVPLSVTTTPNSYQYRQRNNNYNHITFPNTQNIQHNNINNTQHRQPHHYPQTPNNHSHGYHNNNNNNTVSSGVTHHQLNSLTQTTSLYASNLQHMGSQTPGPNMSRLRSKSVTSVNKRNLNGDELECGYYDQIVLMVQY